MRRFRAVLPTAPATTKKPNKPTSEPGKIDRKAYDELGIFRQKGEDEYRDATSRKMLQKQAFFAKATRQTEDDCLANGPQ